MTNLNDMARDIHETAVEKGFWDNYYDSPNEFICTKLALIHSEVTEVLEAIRKNKGNEAIMEEIADVLIRTLDLYAGMNDRYFDENESLHDVMYEKMYKNSSRPRLHGNQF